MSNASESGVSV